jgi:hypothetical protein
VEYRCLVVDKSPTADIRMRAGNSKVPALATGHCLVNSNTARSTTKTVWLQPTSWCGKVVACSSRIDAVGKIVQSHSPLAGWPTGDFSQPDFGTAHDGGFAEYAAVPDIGLVPLAGRAERVERPPSALPIYRGPVVVRPSWRTAHSLQRPNCRFLERQGRCIFRGQLLSIWDIRWSPVQANPIGAIG